MYCTKLMYFLYLLGVNKCYGYAYGYGYVIYRLQIYAYLNSYWVDSLLILHPAVQTVLRWQPSANYVACCLHYNLDNSITDT